MPQMCAAIQRSDGPLNGASQSHNTCTTNVVPSTPIVSGQQYHSDSSDDLNYLPPKNRQPLPASQHPQPPESDNVNNNHNLMSSLTMQGIKVRDFAYERTLPPVTTVPRFSVQVQPRPRKLMRTRDMLNGRDNDEESDEEDPNISRTFYIDSNGTGVSHAYRYRKKSALARTLTEPADDVPPSQGLYTREQAFVRASHRPLGSPQPRQNGALFPSTPQRLMRSLTPIDTLTHSQASAKCDDSQDTESWIDTPLVTPNGSLHYPVHNTSALPASQLESVLPQLPDTEENVTLSQLGFSPERSQQPAYTSPAGSPSRPRLPQLPPPADFRAATCSPAGPSKAGPSNGSHSPVRRSTRKRPSPTPLQDAPAPRYDLRQRPQAARPPAARAASRARASRHAVDQDPSAPPSKRRKISPPTGRGRRKNGDVKENR